MSRIDFNPVSLADKPLYEKYLFSERERGCEFSFANLYLWGEQSIAQGQGHILLRARFGARTVYPYPLGEGDKKAVLDAIIADAEALKISCLITGLDATARETVERLYPDAFDFQYNDGSYDYVYDIDDLSELRGKKYDGKRNHVSRFYKAHPCCAALPITEESIPALRAFAERWYAGRLAADPSTDFHMEKEALARAFDNFRALGLVGVMLREGEDILAFSLASRLREDTFDVHFEKARADVVGAYAAINRALACYIKEEYPTVRYLDREEDMGIAGLRKAKESYHPHHMVKKCRAHLRERSHEN